MYFKLLLLAFILSAVVAPAVMANSSTAGEIKYDANGQPLPVRDPAISPYFTVAPPEIKRLPKKIEVDLSEQKLAYYYGDEYKVDEFKISSGLRKTPTPTGVFTVKSKVPDKVYRGPGYYLPDTKWNLQFLTSGYYIHGAYWHNKFGQPMSHGCVNVSYQDMEDLYSFADIGTKVIIRN